MVSGGVGLKRSDEVSGHFRQRYSRLFPSALYSPGETASTVTAALAVAPSAPDGTSNWSWLVVASPPIASSKLHSMPNAPAR